MKYRVFIDTNIYDGSNYSFSNAVFTSLKSYVEKGMVQLQINSVIEGEVRGHIRERVSGAVRAVNKALKDSVFAGFRHIPELQNRVEKLSESDFVAKADQEFQNLLVVCNTKRIGVNGIDVEKIMNDYFLRKPPFENKKPEEFKDAIAVASINEEVKNLGEDEIYCVVSGDKGFIDAVKLNVQVPQITNSDKQGDYHGERLQVYDSLKSLLDYLTKLKKRSEYLGIFLKKYEVSFDIEETVRKVIESVDYQFEDIEPWIEEKVVTDIFDINFKTCVLDVYDDETAMISLDVDAMIKIEYTYTDEQDSYYDREEQRYLWQTLIENEGTYNIDFEMVLLIDISECGQSIDEGAEILDDMEMSDEDVIEIKDVLEEPIKIQLGEKNCISTERISSSGPIHDGEVYTYCPHCGISVCRENDGGNGFCEECAREFYLG